MMAKINDAHMAREIIKQVFLIIETQIRFSIRL